MVESRCWAATKRILLLSCVAIVMSALPAAAQPTADVEGVRDLADAVAAERQRIAELTAELERRNAALAGLSSRIEALEAAARAAPATQPLAPTSPGGANSDTGNAN